ncbi:hypothetical protein Nepgr_010459 [Nepenthes gracilis]|uniref:Uncharacterized protein n=1 Tax=Nepenthes gracilis TaxID=150966 RepID=A0AAD3SD01_NEPGR|nr:hypothetical protein Nepgr_010459 [Nepenthes gracilis]
MEDFPHLLATQFPSRSFQSIFHVASKAVKLPDAPRCHHSHPEVSSESALPLSWELNPIINQSGQLIGLEDEVVFALGNPIAEPCAPQIGGVSRFEGSYSPFSLLISYPVSDSLPPSLPLPPPPSGPLPLPTPSSSPSSPTPPPPLDSSNDVLSAANGFENGIGNPSDHSDALGRSYCHEEVVGSTSLGTTPCTLEVMLVSKQLDSPV